MEKVNGSPPDDGDFSGGSDAWEYRVFQNATHFRLHRYDPDGVQQSAAEPTFAGAVAMALDALKIENTRVLIYACSAAGRAVVVPRGKWEELLKESLNVPQHKTDKPKG